MVIAAGHYIQPELDRIITIALRNFAYDRAQQPDARQLADEFADALQNDTWLLQTATPNPEEGP